MHVKPYLYFDGRAEEALNYYRDALGAEIICLLPFSHNPEVETAPRTENKVMHAAFRLGDTEIFASDGNCGGQASFAGISLCLTVADAAEAERHFGTLSKDGQVQMPMSETFFATRFGMVADKFGVSWLIIAPPQE